MLRSFRLFFAFFSSPSQPAVLDLGVNITKYTHAVTRRQNININNMDTFAMMLQLAMVLLDCYE